MHELIWRVDDFQQFSVTLTIVTFTEKAYGHNKENRKVSEPGPRTSTDLEPGWGESCQQNKGRSGACFLVHIMSDSP